MNNTELKFAVGEHYGDMPVVLRKILESNLEHATVTSVKWDGPAAVRSAANRARQWIKKEFPTALYSVGEDLENMILNIRRKDGCPLFEQSAETSVDASVSRSPEQLASIWMTEHYLMRVPLSARFANISNRRTFSALCGQGVFSPRFELAGKQLLERVELAEVAATVAKEPRMIWDEVIALYEGNKQVPVKMLYNLIKVEHLIPGPIRSKLRQYDILP